MVELNAPSSPILQIPRNAHQNRVLLSLVLVLGAPGLIALVSQTQPTKRSLLQPLLLTEEKIVLQLPLKLRPKLAFVENQ